MAIVTVLGAGRMGTAICTPLLDRGHDVRLVGTHLDVAYVDALVATGIHPGLGHPLPPGASFHQLAALPRAIEGARMLVVGVSSDGIDWAADVLADLLRPGMAILLVTKGLGWDGSALRPSPDLFAARLPVAIRATLRPVAVTGPCIAGELIRRRETCVVFAGRDEDAVGEWARAVQTRYYRVWRSTEFAGCEACAALKNAFAIGFGIAAGLLGREVAEEGAAAMGEAPTELAGVAAHNYEAAVFAEAIVEMARLVGLAGGDPRTAFGLPGIGDLLVTTHARSARLGRLLGGGRSLAEALDEMAGVTLEGLAAIRTVGQALRAFDAAGTTRPDELPLMRHLVAIADGSPVDMPFDQFFGGRA